MTRAFFTLCTVMLALGIPVLSTGGWAQGRPSCTGASSVGAGGKEGDVAGALPRYWPRYVRPKTVLTAVRPTHQDDYVTLLTLSGLVARAAQQGRTDQMIWVHQASETAYSRWFAAMLRQTGAKAQGPNTTLELLKRFAEAGIVRGYILYHPDDSKRDLHGGVPTDTSVNVATSLCAPLGGVAVAENLEPAVQKLGLKRLFDARTLSEAECFARYRKVFNRNVVAMQDPKVPEVRDAAVAMQAFLLSQPGPLYEQALAWANPDSPILGWGIGDEWDMTSRATRHGLFQTDTDWCIDLPLLSTEEAGKTFDASRLRIPHPPSLWDLTWEDDVHYTTFLMSDGDNVQWYMGDFTQSSEHSWWDSPYRGQVTMGWTCCYDNLAQLSPYTLENLFKTATPRDDFVLFGGGYYYPDLFGSSRPGANVLTRHAADIGAYMRLGGLRLLIFNLQQWDSQAGLAAYAVYAKSVPDLLGIFAISYDPYTAGRGNHIWVKGGQDGETPVVSLQYAIWNHAHDPSMGDPVKVAGFLNNSPHQGAPTQIDHFSTVMVHCWSWFRAPHDGKSAEEVDQNEGGKPGTGRGVAAAKWCADLLQPYVRVLTPGAYMEMLRLRMHPQTTLRSQLTALKQQLATQRQRLQHNTEVEKLAQAEAERQAAERAWTAGDYHSSFDHGKHAHTLLTQATQEGRGKNIGVCSSCPFVFFVDSLSPPARFPESLWLEAEWFGPLKGANFSFMDESRQTRGSWAVAGPDAAPAWTQGGESEFMSIAARADEPKEISVGREIEVPEAGNYTLWVRYADYRNKQEAFGVRVRQGDTVLTHVFGQQPIVDELDPMKMTWDWAYGWDSVRLPLAKGKAHVELYTTGPTEARRCIDCLCFTTDPTYHPVGREKPDFAAWKPLREMQQAGNADALPPLALRTAPFATPGAWKIANGPPAFLWNVGQPWLDELKKPLAQRVDAPFSVDPPLLKDFLTAYAGKSPPIYAHPLSGPVVHIPLYPAAFKDGSPFLDWLNRHPTQKFAILLNYGDPTWAQGDSRAAVLANLKRYGDRFVGFIAGESVAYDPVDTAAMEAKIKTATSRTEVLAALREFHTAATVKKFTDYDGAPVTAAEAWAPVISCLSASNEAWAHAICDWGAKQIGHENTGNSPTLARRLAFLRGACRQFGAKLVDYQSCNLGDAATMFSRENFFYPASSRYVLDNSYDTWAGAGVHWLLEDYLLWDLAGVSAFYNEQGVDLYWKPGGNVAGDGFPVQLSPKGKTAEFVMNLAAAHPRGVQFTPIAFLVDEAHGYTQERFDPGAFGLNPLLNPAVLTPGRHEASLRGWFDIAYFPAPLTQGEPASAIRQTYVNGIFGDIFDVIVNAPGHTAVLDTYPVVILAGEVALTPEWGKALRDYVRRGGTLVVSAEQPSGPGTQVLGLPAFGTIGEASSFTWNLTNAQVPSNVFRYHTLTAGKDRVLATLPNGTPLALTHREGKGQYVVLGAPLGLGIDERPIPLLGLLLQRLAAGQVPIQISGDVEWVVNRLENGDWLVALFNNRGVIKPEHGMLPTDPREAQTITLRTSFAVKQSAEWIAGTPLHWQSTGQNASLTLTIPAGAVRFIALTPEVAK